MKVLIIGYFFPPLGGSGVQRLLKFVRYLPEYGIEPVILTVNPFYVKGPRDLSLLKQLPPDLRIYRTPTLDLNWLFKIFWGLHMPKVVTWIQKKYLIPDKDIFWLPFAKRKASTIVRNEQFDLVFVTGGPFSSFLIARFLFEKVHLPYILDFRDEWMNNPTRLTQSFTKYRDEYEHNLEKNLLEQAAAVIYLSDLMKKNFINRYSFLSDKLHRIIPNGYDESDYQRRLLSNRQSGYCRIIFTGSFYDRTQPYLFIQSILELIRSKAINKNKISLELYGKNTQSFILKGVDAKKEEYSFIHLFPYVTHEQSLALQQEADILLIFIAPGINAESGYSGKLFEYIRSGTPIMAICPPHGLAADLVRKTQTGWVFDSASKEDILLGFLDCYRKWEKGELQIKPRWDEIKKYERNAQAGQLADVMKQVVSKVK